MVARSRAPLIFTFSYSCSSRLNPRTVCMAVRGPVPLRRSQRLTPLKADTDICMTCPRCLVVWAESARLSKAHAIGHVGHPGRRYETRCLGTRTLNVNV